MSLHVPVVPVPVPVISKTISKDRKMLLQDGTGAGGMGGKWGQESKVTKEPAN